MITVINLVTKRSSRLSLGIIKLTSTFQSLQYGSAHFSKKDEVPPTYMPDILRLANHRNVGVLAHVDAGKTTITEQMLTLSGSIRLAGNVDDGTTVMDYLPAERERGITIQSAAISFPWNLINGKGKIHLIDTPGHVDFMIEVNRSLSILDGAILVVDAVAGVQAQTQVIWRAINRSEVVDRESLPCLVFVNKMDRYPSDFYSAVMSIENKLLGINPVVIQIPLIRMSLNASNDEIDGDFKNIRVISKNYQTNDGCFTGLVDLIQMKAIIWPDISSSVSESSVERQVPYVVPLDYSQTREPVYKYVTKTAKIERQALIESLAEVNETIEEYYLIGYDPENNVLKASIRESTIQRKVAPVFAGAALRGMGIELLLDAVFDLLPCPIDRMPPGFFSRKESYSSKKKINQECEFIKKSNIDIFPMAKRIPFGHPLHPSLLAFVFKVVHMRKRGGSGDGRVAFARIYSGKIQAKDKVEIISPSVNCNESIEKIKSRTERVDGLLELACAQSNNLEGGICQSGEVCALIGLKTVVTGDTLLSSLDWTDDMRKSMGNKTIKYNNDDNLFFDIDSNTDRFLSGVKSPNPVLTVRMEALSSHEQEKLSQTLELLAVEDPSLNIHDDQSVTLVSGLGELHLEIVLDRLRREHGVQVWTGQPDVAYKESIMFKDDINPTIVETKGLATYNCTTGSKRMSVSMSLRLQHISRQSTKSTIHKQSCTIPLDPIATIGPLAKIFLGINKNTAEKELAQKDVAAHALISGCLGSLKRGPLSSYPLANVLCQIVDVYIEGGITSDTSISGVLRAAVSNIISMTLKENKRSFVILEPFMNLEIFVPRNIVGPVISDLTSRRGVVVDINMDVDACSRSTIIARDSHSDSSTVVYGEVPLSEIIGYASVLRNITRGQGTFSTSYKGYAPCVTISPEM